MKSRKSAKTKTKNRILIVDDEPDITESFGLALEDSGFEVDKYNDPAVALASFKPTVYGLLILDIKMPKMDGLHLTSRIRKEEILKDMPVVIFSSLASEDNIRKWRNIGANDILTKPDLPNLVTVTDGYIRSYAH